MALYFLNYDLRKERDYKKLTEELEKFKAVRVLESCWCFKKMNTTAKDLTNHFSKFIDNEDGIIITEIKEINGRRQWASYKTLGSPKDLP